ncbi:MAG: insulinase family protein, partial [Bacteroidetes bacterium]
MVDFERFKLDNGLTVLVHQDKTTPVVAMNIIYKVGSRDESPDKTGFAHLFEHLM